MKLTQLKGGIDTLVTEYKKLDVGINEYTDVVAQIVAGHNGIISGANELMTGSKSLETRGRFETTEKVKQNVENR